MSNDPVAYGDVLLSIRIGLHLVTFVTVLGYSSEFRTRLFSTLLAFLLAGTSFAMAVQCMTRFDVMGPVTEPWSIMFFAVVLVIVGYNGGNVAKVLHQARKWMPERL